jgi:Small-conductance mechanosensitive channel
VVASVRGISVYFRLKETAETDADPLKRSHLIVVRKVAVGAIVGLGALFALQASGIDPGPLLAGGAIGGVIIGLALQESLSNVFSGLLFALDPSVRVGDHVRLENGREGFVRQIGWRSTLIRQLDDTVVVVPNAMISRQQVLNMSRPAPPLTVWVECSVAYEDDLELAERVAVEAARSVQRALSAGGSEVPPDESAEGGAEPFVRWQGFGENGVTFRLFIQADTPVGQYRAKSDLVKALHRALRAAGVTIPHPIRDVRVTMSKAGPSGSPAEGPYSF